MSIGREYYDSQGNYWQIETPYYIPPEEAIKNPEYVRGFVSAEDRRKKTDFWENTRRINKRLSIACIVVLVFLLVVIAVKGVPWFS